MLHATVLMAATTASTLPPEQPGGGDLVGVDAVFQFRLAGNVRDQAPASSEDLTIGSSIHRGRVRVTVRPELWTIRVTTAFGSATGAATLSDAWIERRFDRFRVGAGQFKPAFLAEEGVDFPRQLGTERSVVNETFSPGRVQGVWGEYADEDWRAVVAITDGFNSANTDFNGVEADWGATVRGEFVIDGHRRELEDFTGFVGNDLAARVGASAHYESGGHTAAGPTLALVTTPIDRSAITADVQVEGDGWNVFAAVAWSRLDPAAGVSTDDVGLIVQGGWMPGEAWEIFARGEVIIPDDAINPALDAFPIATIGATHFFIPGSHALKVVGDAAIAFEPFAAGSIVPAFGGGTGVFGAGSAPATGLIFDTGDPQVVLRLVLQSEF